LPNNLVAESQIINYSKKDPKIRVKVDVSVSYETDLDKAKKALIDVAKKNKEVMKDPAPDIVIDDFGDSGVKLELRAWIPNAHFIKKTPSDLRYAIKKEFRKRRIEIPYPRMFVINGGKAKR
jgi:small-conductance mechanosensitive channel